MSSSRIAHLASIITDNTTKIDNYLSSHDLPSPSFDADAPVALLQPKEVAAPRDALLEAITELQALALGPLGILQSQAAFHNNLLSLQAIYRFQIAKAFPCNEEASYTQISEACGLNEPDLRRILRHAMTNRIFTEPRKGVVAHTGASRVLQKNTMMHEWIGMVCEEMWPAAARTVDAMVQWPGSQEPMHTGFALTNNTQDPLYVELAKDPERAHRFATAMSVFNTGEGYEPSHLLANYPFSSLGPGTVVDVGGSHGAVSCAIAREYPELRCIVQDLPETVADGPTKIPAELAERVTFMAHDFFTEQPVVGAQVYYFRWIFHNWSDKYSVEILRNLIPALKKGARVVISDYCLPEPNRLSLLKEKPLRAFDLAMLEIQNSKEREADDWAKLFQAADPRFTFLGVKQPPGSKLAIIEAMWEG